MIDQQLNCLPVVDESRRLVGLLTATDFLVVAHQALTGGRIERAPREI
jgi:CBS-domain-containing membrane protein